MEHVHGSTRFGKKSGIEFAHERNVTTQAWFALLKSFKPKQERNKRLFYNDLRKSKCLKRFLLKTVAPRVVLKASVRSKHFRTSISS